jgi:hypothetical protein
MRMLRYVFVAAIVALAGARLGAQGPIGAPELTQLDATAGEVERLIAALPPTFDAARAANARMSMADLRDDITYLHVKLRREGVVTPAEYADVRGRLDLLRAKVQGTRVTAQPIIPGDEDRVRPVPVGTELDVRLQTPLNSGTARIEDRFDATTVMDLMQDGQVAIPAGSVARGFVSSVRAAGKVERRGTLTLSFDQLLLEQRTVRLRATVVQALDPKVGEDVSRIGAGAVIGAVIGGIFGGGKGALVGVLIGGGGTMASTEGSDVDLPAGTVLRIRIDQPLDLAR